MSKIDLERLVYRRQYLLVPRQIDCPFLHRTWQLTSSYTLYAHSDLLVNEFETDETKLVLIGDMFDFEDPQKGNVEILEDLVSEPLNDLLERTARFSGRFVLILIKEGHIFMLHDSTAARKVYYSSLNGENWFGSQSHLLAKVMGYQPSDDSSRQEYYNSTDFNKQNNADLGDTTSYKEISQLMPNHYFDVDANRRIRYWPLKYIEQNSLKDATERCAVMLRGYMESISNRYEVMLPVTSGGDSRLLMSATRNIRDRFLYYINLENQLSVKSTDIRVPKRLFQKLSINFNLVELPTEIDISFRKVYMENNPLASERYLPHIYNYYLNYSDKINLPGNIASAPWGINHMNKDIVSTDEMLKFYGVKNNYTHPEAYYRQWIESTRNVCDCCNLNVINLFYWEERMANWGTQVALDKDIAQEDINPFNSRLLNELFLSVHPKYNTQPGKRLHQSIISVLWPELMQLPFNPSLKTTIKVLLAQYGLISFAERSIYMLKKKQGQIQQLNRAHNGDPGLISQ